MSQAVVNILVLNEPVNTQKAVGIFSILLDVQRL